MTKKTWIVLRGRHELPSKRRRKFKRHKTLAEAVIEARRLCFTHSVYPAPSYRIFECVAEFKKRRNDEILMMEAH